MRADLRVEHDRRINAQERQVEEDLATLGLLEQHWESYRQTMSQQAARFEEVAGAAALGSYVAQKDVTAVREIAAYAKRLASEQQEVCVDAARARRMGAEAEIELLRQERGGSSWG